MPEREVIEFIRGLAGGDRPSWLVVDVGDDAAAVELSSGQRILVTVDSVVEGVHFESGTPAPAVARKAMARALSDIAAMAARPLCTVAAVSFPRCAGDAACRELVRSLWEAAAELSARLIGGDVASGGEALSVTVTALGTPGPAGIITRSGARPGDALCVTGRLGGSPLGRHLTFRPRIQEALALAERCDLRAMIDISDGLSTDALHLAEASGVGLTLHADAVPLSGDARALADRTGREALWHALNDGEDYELLFCVPMRSGEELARTGVGETPVSLIGEVTESRDSHVIMSNGARAPLKPGGWEHLKA